MIERELEFQIQGTKVVLRRDTGEVAIRTYDGALQTKVFEMIKAMVCGLEARGSSAGSSPLPVIPIKIGGDEIAPASLSVLERRFGPLQTESEAQAQAEATAQVSASPPPSTEDVQPESVEVPIEEPSSGLDEVVEATAIGEQERAKLQALADDIRIKAEAAAAAESLATPKSKVDVLAHYRKGKNAPRAKSGPEALEVGDKYKGLVIVAPPMVDSSMRETHGDLYRLILENGDVASINAAGDETLYEPAEFDVNETETETEETGEKPDDGAPESTVLPKWTAAGKRAEREETAAEQAADRTEASEAAVDASDAVTDEVTSFEDIVVPDVMKETMSVSVVMRWFAGEFPTLAKDEDGVLAWAVKNTSGVKAFMGQTNDRLRRRVTNLLATHTGGSK